jgi:hypothetical protein
MERGFRGEVSLIDAYNYRTSLKALWLQKTTSTLKGASASLKALPSPVIYGGARSTALFHKSISLS